MCKIVFLDFFFFFSVESFVSGQVNRSVVRHVEKFEFVVCLLKYETLGEDRSKLEFPRYQRDNQCRSCMRLLT